jgi:hypothetical protein
MHAGQVFSPYIVMSARLYLSFYSSKTLYFFKSSAVNLLSISNFHRFQFRVGREKQGVPPEVLSLSSLDSKNVWHEVWFGQVLGYLYFVPSRRYCVESLPTILDQYRGQGRWPRRCYLPAVGSGLWVARIG